MATVTVLYERALQIFAKASEAIVMESPAKALLHQAYTAFDQVLEVNSRWFPAVYYQAQICSLLWQTTQAKDWISRTLRLYQRVLNEIQECADLKTQLTWQIKVLSERADFLTVFNPDAAIADLSTCIRLSNHHRFYPRRGYLYLMEGRLLAATDDFLVGMVRLGEYQRKPEYLALEASLSRKLESGQLALVLSKLTEFWQQHILYC